MSIIKNYQSAKGTCKVTFSYPLTEGVKTVQVLGDFNNWDSAKAPKMRKGKTELSAVIELAAGQEYAFRYLLDGNTWANDNNADKYATSPFAGIENSVIVIDSVVKKGTAAKATKTAVAKPAKATPAKVTKTVVAKAVKTTTPKVAKVTAPKVEKVVAKKVVADKPAKTTAPKTVKPATAPKAKVVKSTATKVEAKTAKTATPKVAKVATPKATTPKVSKPVVAKTVKEEVKK